MHAPSSSNQGLVVQGQSSTASPSLAATTPALTETDDLTLKQQVALLRHALDLDLKLSIPAALREANSKMGMTQKHDGASLPDQATNLLAKIGL